jgi:hypothetical protein
MFRVLQHPSSGVLKTVSAASGIGHDAGTATSFHRGLIRTRQTTNLHPARLRPAYAAACGRAIHFRLVKAEHFNYSSVSSFPEE